MNIYPRLTPARRAWLELLEREGEAEWHGKGRTRFDCMRLGWTAWVLPGWGYAFEYLTDEGQRVLNESRGIS